MAANYLALAYIEESIRRSLRTKILSPTRLNSFDLPENEFISLFRLSKNLTRQLCNDLKFELESSSMRMNCLSVETKVLCALRFLATGSHQKGVTNDLALNMCQKSASNCITEVVDAINTVLFKKWIQFPTSNRERNKIKQDFLEYANFPGVIGLIDCTHVAIVSPNDDGYNNKRNFINRKGFYSINVQIICDAKLKILNLCARFPGCTCDSYIWRSSNFYAAFQSGVFTDDDSWLLGDSGYAEEPWLLTPVNEPTDVFEAHYNRNHQLCMTLVERCSGVLKSRFRCLLKNKVLHYTPEKAAKIINACATLHNMCIEDGLEFPVDQDMENDDLPFNTVDVDSCESKSNNSIRSHLMSVMFSN